MSAIGIDVLLALMGAVCWLAAAGFLRLGTAFDRLHCVALVNVVAGPALLFAALIADGPSARVLKILVAVAAALVGNAALAHASGRALLFRGRNR